MPGGLEEDMPEIDCRGLACPKPVLETKDAVEGNPGEEVVVRVDNQAAVINVSRFLKSRGWMVEVKEDGEGGFYVTGSPSGEAASCELMPDLPREGQKILVIIPTDRFGRGDEVLGRGLMKNFISTLGEMGDELWRVVLVNSGVHLAIEGSECLDALEALLDRGVGILVCGTCLNHYGLLERKAVGETTNMLDIVTSMQLASKVISL